jgi:hypothetical protein
MVRASWEGSSWTLRVGDGHMAVDPRPSLHMSMQTNLISGPNHSAVVTGQGSYNIDHTRRQTFTAAIAGPGDVTCHRITLFGRPQYAKLWTCYLWA